MGTILVVDDDETVCSLLQEILTHEGHSCTTTNEGADALDKIARDHYDLIILDHTMPKMTGTDILLRVRADPRLAKLPVVILTADGLYLRKGEAGTAAGDPDACLPKPIERAKLVALVKTMLGRDAKKPR